MRKAGFLYFFLAASLFGLPDVTAQSWQWGVSNNSTYSGVVEAIPVAVDTSGNVFIAGLFFLADSISIGAHTLYNPSSETDLFIVKADSSGSILWTANTHDSYSFPVSIATDEIGNLYVLGQYIDATCSVGSFTLLNPSSLIMNFLAKFSPTGDVLWATNIAGQYATGYSTGGVGVDGTGNVYVAGHFNLPIATIGTTMLINTSTTGDSSDIFIVKYDSLGNSLWAKNYGGHGDDYTYAMSVNKSGNFYVLGKFSSQTIIIGSDTLTDSLFYPTTIYKYSFISKFDSSGNPIWAHVTNRHVILYDIKADASENVLVTGNTNATIIMGPDTIADATGNLVTLVAKYDSSGSILWAKSAGSNTGFSEGFALAVDTCGNSWVAGSTNRAMNFSGHVVDTPAIHDDIMFIGAYDHCGNYIVGSGMELPSGGDDPMGLALDGRGNLFVGGDYKGTSMILGFDTLHMPGIDKEFLLLAKYTYGAMPCSYFPCSPTPSLTTKSENTITRKISLYPNPATNECSITSNIEFSAGSVAEIYDLTGRLVNIFSLSGSSSVISVTNLSRGLYQCRIITGDQNVVVKKLVVMK